MKRLFFSQSMLDSMQEAGKIRVEKGILTMLTGGQPSFRLVPACRLVRTIETNAAPGELTGRILSEQELKEMQAEVYGDSVIHKEVAYQADPGFIASPAEETGTPAEEPPAEKTANADDLSQFILDNLR